MTYQEGERLIFQGFKLSEQHIAMLEENGNKSAELRAILEAERLRRERKAKREQRAKRKAKKEARG